MMLMLVGMGIMTHGLYRALRYGQFRKMRAWQWSERAESPLQYWIFVTACLAAIAIFGILLINNFVGWMDLGPWTRTGQPEYR
jgi:hypothetical protein